MPLASVSDGSLLIVVGIIGATVMPHALFVHSWLSKNKMDLIGRKDPGTTGEASLSSSITDSMKPAAIHHPYTTEEKVKTNKIHLVETIALLTVAGVVNAGILLVAIPFYPNVNITINSFVSGVDQLFGPDIGVLFLLTLLASGLSSSALGTIAGQIIMEGMTGKHVNLWLRRIVTRGINVFPTTIAILLGLPLLNLLIYSQVVLSIMIPLPMIPLVYYTSKKKFMGTLVNKRNTIILALITVGLILGFNTFLIYTSI